MNKAQIQALTRRELQAIVRSTSEGGSRWHELALARAELLRRDAIEQDAEAARYDGFLTKTRA